MSNPDTPNSTHDLLSALADGELDLRESTDALARIADDPQGAQRIAFQQQLRRSVASAMDEPAMRCPEALRARVERVAQDAAADSAPTNPAPAPATTAPAPAAPTPTTAPRPAGPPVLARIGRWAPAAVAAILLIAATGVFFAGRPVAQSGPSPTVLDVNTIQTFASHHMHCAEDPASRLHHPERFGEGLDELPGHLADYFDRSADGVAFDLSAVEYDYQLAGVCNLPGSGAVHLVYRHHDHPDRAMSLWIVPAKPEVVEQMTPGRVYIETAKDLDHPVILWEDSGLLFYLVGDSLEDAQHAVHALRHPPA